MKKNGFVSSILLFQIHFTLLTHIIIILLFILSILLCLDMFYLYGCFLIFDNLHFAFGILFLQLKPIIITFTKHLKYKQLGLCILSQLVVLLLLLPLEVVQMICCTVLCQYSKLTKTSQTLIINCRIAGDNSNNSNLKFRNISKIGLNSRTLLHIAGICVQTPTT